MRVLTYLLVGLGLCLVACQETEFLGDQVGEVVFAMEFELNEEPFLWEAGNDDFFMFTSINSTNLDFTSFQGDLRKDRNCTDECHQGLQIIFNQSILADPSNSFSDGSQSFLLDSTQFISTQYILYLNAETTGQEPIIHEWFIEGIGTFGPGPDLQLVINEADLMDPYFVRLTTTDANGCVSSSEQLLTILGNGVSDDCNPRFLVNVDASADSVTFEAVSQDFEGEYIWSYPGLSGPSSTINLADIDTQICLRLFLPPDCDLTYCENINLQSGELENCGTFFSASPVITAIDTVITSAVDEGVTIILKVEENGAPVTYQTRSDRPQPATSYFRIQNNTPYLQNENGENTRLLEIEFQCEVYNVNGDSKTISNAKGTFGVGSFD